MLTNLTEQQEKLRRKYSSMVEQNLKGLTFKGEDLRGFREALSALYGDVTVRRICTDAVYEAKTNQIMKDEKFLHQVLYDIAAENQERCENPPFTFKYNGLTILDSFSDESGRVEVDPVEYYGKENISKIVREFVEATDQV